MLTGTTLTDTSAPKLTTIDPIESSGSILLVEPMHPTQQWTAGVPANSAAVPNILASIGGPLVGSASGDASVSFSSDAAKWTASTGKIERTSKGGIHAITSTTQGVNGQGMSLVVNVKVRDFMTANPTHNYYFSTWVRVTRQTIGASIERETYLEAGNAASFSSSIKQILASGGNFPLAGRTSGADGKGAPVGGYLVNSSSATWSGTPATTGANMRLNLMPIGSGSAYVYSEAMVRAASSKVFYRVYIEDLTVSGRTYATVDAIDSALYTKHVLTAGGRYYGDTFTDPTTIP